MVCKTNILKVLVIVSLGIMVILLVLIILSGKCLFSGNTWTNPQDESIMVWIPGGKFMMARDTREENNMGHPVAVEGFWLGRYEVTNEQYALFLQATEYWEPDFWDDPDYNQPKSPVVGITWEDALAYCEWAGVRLPTEAEWEYAAAAGEKQYPYGTATGELNHDLANYAGVRGKDRWEYTSPVGSFSPNPFGLCDMAGNAWEWCSSIMKPLPYLQTDGREDLEETRELRIMRGGAWVYGSDYCHVSDRHYHRQDLRFDYAGFRVALSHDDDFPEKKNK